MDIRIKSLLQAMLVTFLWSTSFIIIKKTLDEITPLVFASYRYVIASIVLISIVLSKKKNRSDFSMITQRWWTHLLLYGIVFIFLTQGAGYLTLSKLPAITLSFTLNFTTILVVIIGALVLKERASSQQIFFIIISIIGAVIYFYPIDLTSEESIGYLYVLIALLANVISTVHGRLINQNSGFAPLTVTSVSMTIGTIFLLVTAAMTEGLTVPSLTVIISIIWLGVVNTAFAFTLWNQALNHIKALEASIILNTILPQITILSYIFLDERPSLKEWLGLIVIVISVSLVQYFGMKNSRYDTVEQVEEYFN